MSSQSAGFTLPDISHKRMVAPSLDYPSRPAGCPPFRISSYLPWHGNDGGRDVR